MGVTALPKVVAELLAAGMDPATPAAMVEQGTTAAQRRVVSTLADLADDVARSGLAPPALFVIGPTVRHADRLDWFGRLPLAGHTAGRRCRSTPSWRRGSRMPAPRSWRYRCR